MARLPYHNPDAEATFSDNERAFMSYVASGEKSMPLGKANAVGGMTTKQIIEYNRKEEGPHTFKERWQGE